MTDHPAHDAPPPLGMARQLAIYLAGAEGHPPDRPLTYERLEAAARWALPGEAFGYLAGGAGSEDTMRANREAFRRWRIVPRVLCDATGRELGTKLLGERLPAPVLLAPLGVQGILHADGELGSARGAASHGVPIVLSTVSSNPLEAVAEAMGTVPRWFQLYWPADRELAASFLGRAEAAGFSAIVVTLDVVHLAWRPRDLAHGYLPFLHAQGLANYLTDPVFLERLELPPEDDPAPAIRAFARLFSDPSLTWDDLAWLREATSLPIVLKGILDPDDARRAVDHGAAAVVVSNHGGRQVDGAIAALDALPAIVDAIGGRIEILFDSGIRTAADAFIAIALGARAVLLGRPYACALAVGGEAGVREYVHDFLAELDLTLGLAGCRSWDEVGRDRLTAIGPGPTSGPPPPGRHRS